jgi:RNA polymerase sigma factor (sigma-70 family)
MDQRKAESRKEDSRLIDQAIGGNQKAFHKLRVKYYTAVYKLIGRMIKNKEEVEDLAQEAFIKAFSSLASFNDEYAFSTWLFKIATNNSIDYIRKKKLQTFSIDKPVESEESDYSFELAGTDPEPDQELMASQRKKMLEDAMNELPAKYRQVIIMRHVDEKEYSEISKILKLPLGTVKAHIFRARELLYRQLRDKMHNY